MRVLVIPENFRNDRYVLKPIITSMFKQIGRNAKIEVCTDPLLGGIAQALKWSRIKDILFRYKGMVDLFVLCVDRDGEEKRKLRLDGIEKSAAEMLPENKLLLAENAWQETEVWILAGHDDLPKEWQWKEIRSEINPKEIYYLPYAKSRNLLDEPGEGRKTLASEASKKYSRIRRLCGEIGELEGRIRDWL